MVDERTHISTVEDMAVYDALPERLRKFLDTAPLGLDATTVAEFYKQKQDQCWADDDDPIGMVLLVLREYMKRQGVTDFRPLEWKPRKRRC